MPKKRLLERSFEAPARLLEDGITIAEKEETKIKKPLKLAEEYWGTLGPGLTTGASDDDPSGIATYSQAGAQYGFSLLWLAWVTFPLMAVVQEMCARIGVVTGRGLAANIRHGYSKWVLYVVTLLLFVANTFNIGADLGAMAKGLQLLDPRINFAIAVIGFAAISLLLQIFMSYARYSKYLKFLALILFAYVFSALMSDINWSEVAFHSIIPTLSFSRDQLYLVCGILGTTISPYLFFWQTSQEVEEKNLRGQQNGHAWHQNVSPKEMRFIRTDVWSGMFFSNFVMFFIIAACAATLYSHGITNIGTAADAALALEPFAGRAAFGLFAVGIIGTGLLAIPVLAGSTSYAISESFGWKHGLYKKLKEAYAFYGVMIASVVLGIILNFVGIHPIQALIYSAVLNGLVAPVILVLIVRIASNKTIMREYVSSSTLKFIGWLTVLLMIISGVAAVLSLFLK